MRCQQTLIIRPGIKPEIRLRLNHPGRHISPDAVIRKGHTGSTAAVGADGLTELLVSLPELFVRAAVGLTQNLAFVWVFEKLDHTRLFAPAQHGTSHVFNAATQIAGCARTIRFQAGALDAAAVAGVGASALMPRALIPSAQVIARYFMLLPLASLWVGTLPVFFPGLSGVWSRFARVCPGLSGMGPDFGGMWSRFRWDSVHASLA